MSRVYIVERTVDYEAGDILGIFTSLKAARKLYNETGGDGARLSSFKLNTVGSDKVLGEK